MSSVLAVLHKANISAEVQIISRIWNRSGQVVVPWETLCYELESPEAVYPGDSESLVERIEGLRKLTLWFLSCFKCADDAVRSESKRFAYNLN